MSYIERSANPSCALSKALLNLSIVKFYELVLLGLCLNLLLSSPLSATDLTPSALKQVAQSKQWRSLLLYKVRYFENGVKSEVKNETFFLSSEGGTDPLLELKAELDAFSLNATPTAPDTHPQCVFPARYAFLKKVVDLRTMDLPCPGLAAFLKEMDGDSVTLVHSSAYPNSPPSMFGHTFLRINSKSKRSHLLDYGVNYSAQAGEDENPLKFAWLGLTGGYSGQFGIVPYYTKVNEYVHSESRDLWEYDLNFSPEETHFLLLHLWELDRVAQFNYYFIDQNCSYKLLNLIESAKPEWDLDHFWLHVIPAETIKQVVKVPQSIRSIHYRPSLQKQMLDRYRKLNPHQKKDFEDLLAEASQPSKIIDAAPIEAALSRLRYRKQSARGDLNPDDQKLYSALLSRRSEMGESPGLAESEPENQLVSRTENERTRPDLGHGPYSLSVSTGLLNPKIGTALFFEEIHFKLAYHDLLDNDLGYLRFSQVDFPNITLRHTPGFGAIQIEKIEAVHITSLFPMNELEKQLSWRATLQYASPKDFGCLNCHIARSEGGVGAAYEIFQHKMLIYGLVSGYFEVGGSLEKGYRWGPILQLASYVTPWEHYTSLISVSWVSDVAQSDRRNFFPQFEWDHGISLSQDWQVRLGTSLIPDAYQEVKVALRRYF